MAILPETVVEQIAFCESHQAAWRTHAERLGLSALQIESLGEALAAAREAFDAANRARAAAQAATTRLHGNADALAAVASAIVRTIKTTASNSENAIEVLALGRIPERAANSPKRAPGKATNINVDLVGSGAVKLRWTASSASASSGAFFDVLRKLPGDAAYTSIGACEGTTARTRTMSFVDNTLPATAAGLGVRYIIVPRRGTNKGEMSEAITVQVGVKSAAAGVKMAA
jgi:hypothetical protein